MHRFSPANFSEMAENESDVLVNFYFFIII